MRTVPYAGPYPSVHRRARRSARDSTPVHTLIQLTDIHMVPDRARLAGGLDPYPGLVASLTAVEGSGLRPSALLCTGDLVENGDAASYRRFRAVVEPVAARIGARLAPS